jgi:hypothetical protein
MELVTFPIDLGDCRAIFTGRVVGRLDQLNKVTYYNPMAGQYQTSDVPDQQILNQWHTKAGMLPLFPVVEEPLPRQTVTTNSITLCFHHVY